jgi:hypothetical protein
MSLYFKQVNGKLSANITFYQFTRAKKIAEIPNVFENCKSLSVIFVNLRVNLYFLDPLKVRIKIFIEPRTEGCLHSLLLCTYLLLI